MTLCPRCGRELLPAESECPVCTRPRKKPFTIKSFLWENFRLFTMIGMTGTMISLIPNMGNRVLGAEWITNAESILPLFLSIIIFFGAIFLTICFLIIFGMIFENRRSEPIARTYLAGTRATIIRYEGDLQRAIMLICLVPMWIGIVLFFLLLMPQIPNRYSWLFSVIMVLTVAPLVLYACLGWKIGKQVSGTIPVLNRFPRARLVLFTVAIVLLLIFFPLAFPHQFGNDLTFSNQISLATDQQFYGPAASTAKGLRLEAINLSGREELESRFLWSADYGYFVSVIPSTGEVTVLGDRVEQYGNRYIYWTFPKDATLPSDRPVTVNLRIVTFADNVERESATLCLDRFTNGIVRVNATCSHAR